MNLSRYFVRKPMETIIAESNNHELKRSLSALNLVSLGIGCIIGAGIFVLTGQAAAVHAGPAIMLSFVLAGLTCAFAALCYAELASVLPVSGSAYTYAYATLGESIAWAMGWLLILEYGLASATVAVGWSGYVASFLKDFGIIIPASLSGPYFDMIPDVANPGHFVFAATGNINLPALLGILGVTALLIRGVSESATVNNVIVMIKLAVVLLFIVVGAFYVHPANWHPFIPAEMLVPTKDDPLATRYGLHGILAGAGAIFFAYIGFEAVSTAAQEAKNPKRDMPIGILGSLAICTVLYMLVAAVLTGIVPYKELGVAQPIALAVDYMHLPWLSFIIKLGAIMGLSSVMLVLVYGQTRVFYMMAKDGLLPGAFCVMHAKFKTPWINTLIVGACVAFAAAVTPIRVLGDLVSMGTLFAFCIVCFSVMYLRYKRPDLHRPFKTPFMPVTPILGIISCCYLIYGIKDIFVALRWYFLVGVLVYIVYGQFHSKINNAAKLLKPTE